MPGTRAAAAHARPMGAQPARSWLRSGMPHHAMMRTASTCATARVLQDGRCRWAAFGSRVPGSGCHRTDAQQRHDRRYAH